MIGRTTGDWGTMVSRLATGITGYGSAAGNWACCGMGRSCGSGKTIGCAVTLDSLEPRHFILRKCLLGSLKKGKQNYNTSLSYHQQTIHEL